MVRQSRTRQAIIGGGLVFLAALGYAFLQWGLPLIRLIQDLGGPDG